jgi:anti-sigma B factor antagonist
VDLAGLEFVDCHGLGVLVRVLKWTRESGGHMSLAAPQRQVRWVLEITGLIDVFSVYPSMNKP